MDRYTLSLTMPKIEQNLTLKMQKFKRVFVEINFAERFSYILLNILKLIFFKRWLCQISYQIKGHRMSFKKCKNFMNKMKIEKKIIVQKG